VASCHVAGRVVGKLKWHSTGLEASLLFSSTFPGSEKLSASFLSWRGEGGWGVTRKKLTRGGYAPRSDSLPFYIPFWQKRYPYSYTLH